MRFSCAEIDSRKRVIACVRTIRCDSTREENADLFAIYRKACTVVGRGGEALAM